MSVRRRRLIGGAALASAALGAGTFLALRDKVGGVMRRFVRDHGLFGGACAYGPPSAPPILDAVGLADPGTGRPVREGDLFRIASLSKPLTAAAVRALEWSAGLPLDATLPEVLGDSISFADPRARTMTVRHLLRHEGGWDVGVDLDPYFLRADALRARLGRDGSSFTSFRDVALAMLARDLQFAPGTRQAYSNVGYAVLGLVIERAAGLPYADAVHDLLPATQGMGLGTADVIGPLAPGDAELLVNHPPVIGPAGGWVARAADYHAFCADAIDAAVLERPAHAVQGNWHYGLGWRVWQLGIGTFLTHFGSMPGAFSIVVRQPGGLAVVMLFNGRPRDSAMAFDALFRGLLEAGVWR